MPRQNKNNHVDPSVASGTSPTLRTPADEFITVKQLSERLHVTKATIWDWCRRRNRDPLPHFAISRKVVLFRWSDIVRWIEGRAA